MTDLFSKTLQSLDWPRILERLGSFAGSAPGRERIEALTFSEDLDDVRRLQEETTEVRAILDSGTAVPIGGIRDIRGIVASGAKGEILVGRELLDVANTLGACQQLRRFFAGLVSTTPRVNAVSTRLHDLQELTALLGNSFDASGDLSTGMYPALAQLRTRIHALHGRIKDKLGSMLGSEELSSLAQDTYVTMRGDRYVIPLKVQARSMDVGIVHDTSGSGQTVFVEPRQVIPMNNDLKLAEAELKREERKILTELSRRVAVESYRILENVSIAAELEFIHARARLSQELAATPPVLVSSYHIRLNGARHPVLVLRGIDVIPNDLSIGLDFQALILSGPNTGGKTVALKTLGLCALMTRAGLHIPADPGSEVGLFGTVLTDIGDQQTIEQDLSTFSGHVVGIKRILEHMGNDGSDALILLDEIAVGTDPAQGAALARALLEAFVDRGAKIVSTTHYAELKTLSVQDRRFANGRVEFDAVGMRPTYRVVIGTPGRSYALDIADKLGIGGEIIRRARGYVAGGQRALEDLLGELEQALSRTRDEKILLERERKDAETLRQRYETRLQEVDREAEKLRQKAMSKFEVEVRQAREEIARVVRELQKGASTRSVTTAGAAEARERVNQVARKVREQAPAPPVDPIQAAKPIDAKALKKGDPVLVISLKKEGVVHALPDGDGGLIEVMVGGLRLKLWPDDLRQPLAQGAKSALASKTPQYARKVEAATPRPAPTTFTAQDPLSGMSGENELDHAFQTSQNTLDLRGARVDEGIDQLERFLDKVSLKGEQVVIIVHGHGTGAMKTAVRDYLAKSPYVERFQPGGKGQGGDGATVVALR